MTAWLQRVRQSPELARDALAFVCLALAFLLGGDLPDISLSLSLPLLAAVFVLLVLGLGMASALFGVVLLMVSCTRFLWTPICPRGDRNDEAQHERNRSS